MANKRISELSSRTPSATDLMLVGDPTTGYSYKCLVSQVGGVTSVFGRTGAVTAQEGDYSLTLLSDVTITAPTVDQVLIYNGTSWVNAENYSNKTQHLVKLGAAIGKGKAVYVSGASGTNMIVNLSSNDSEATSSKVMGLTATGGALNDMVYVITEGLLPGIDTSGSTVGDAVWLGTNGNLIFGVANRPVPPLNAVYLGVVTRVSATVGEVFIRVQNGFELEELHDVKFTSLANNHALVYNSTSQLWENKALSTTNVTEGTNLYYTDARARAAISLTTTGSGAATYNSSTGVLNIPTPSSVNIYNADGTLTGPRVVTQGSNNLTFTSVNNAVVFTSSGASTFIIGKQIQLNSGNAVLDDNQLLTYNNFKVGTIPGNVSLNLVTNNTSRLLIFGGGNIAINSTTDAGFRLDVNGTMRVQGIATLAASYTNIGTGSLNFGPTNDGQNYNAAGTGLLFAINPAANANRPGLVLYTGSINPTSGVTNLFGYFFASGFNPSSGNATLNFINIGGTSSSGNNAVINTTGTYSGIIRGLYFNPTLTSTTGATIRAIETVTGDVLMCTSSGYVGIGATADTSYKLSVDGDLRVYGNLRTAQPTGGTGIGVWRLGSTATGTYTMSTTTCVEIEIGGTLYRLATVTPA